MHKNALADAKSTIGAKAKRRGSKRTSASGPLLLRAFWYVLYMMRVCQFKYGDPLEVHIV